MAIQDGDLSQWFDNILRAVNAQKKDETIWFERERSGENYLVQSLSWLHQVILENDYAALKKILRQSGDEES